MAARDYNYQRFRALEFGDLQFPGPKAGDAMFEVEARDLEGRAVRLADFRGQTVVLETGSCTCPAYAAGIDSMNKIAADHPGVVFLVLYVREAHPGNLRAGHKTADEKQQRAASLRAWYGEKRRVLVDDLAGSVHLQFGGLPNLIYVIDAAGTVVFRSDWSRPKLIEAALAAAEQRTTIARDHFEIPAPPPFLALRVLMTGGWLSVWDLVREAPFMAYMHWVAERRWRREQKQTSAKA